jgi:hypothetical protein
MPRKLRKKVQENAAARIPVIRQLFSSSGLPVAAPGAAA